MYVWKKKTYQPETFEDALNAAREQLAAQDAAAQQAAAAQTTEVGQETADGAQAAAPEQPAPAEQQTAPAPNVQQAAQTPEDTIRELQRQNAQLYEDNRRLTETISEQSRAAEQAAVREARKPPELDLQSLWADDEETAKARLAAFTGDMAAYVKAELMDEMQPYINDAQAGRYEREMQGALNELGEIPQFGGIKDMSPAIERIINGNPILKSSDAPVEDKVIMAFTLARGADVINNPPKAPTNEDFMRMYRESPELRREVERARAMSAAEAENAAPPAPRMSANTGAASAPLSRPPKAPTTWDEAKAAMLAKLGFGN